MCLLLAVIGLIVLAAPASSEERLLTRYSRRIDSEPYVHKSTTVILPADGKHAPALPGYVLGFKEQVLVDSKDPDAKPLPVNKMMVHHFLFYTLGRVDALDGGCLGGQFLGGRGEEHPNGRFDQLYPPEIRARFGVRNATPAGKAPTWSVTAMVMNHYKKPKRFWVRTKVWYTTEPRAQVYPTTVGDCSHFANGMAYDVPGGGAAGSTYVDRSTWTVPFNARIIGGASHHHGGALHQTLSSQTCGRSIFDAKAYYGDDDHIYNTIRPILHEPGPIANGTFRTLQGVPVSAGEVLSREAFHSNVMPHVAAMGFWILQLVRDDSVTPCAPMPSDLAEVTVPPRYDRAPPFVYDRVVPQLAPPSGRWRAFSGAAVPIGDQFFRPGKLTVRAGSKVTWRFSGAEPHSVTVANGPRGFSSSYLGNVTGSYSFTPTVPGTYRLTCLIHPTTMGQTLRVVGRSPVTRS
jgi:plastocyanin